MHRLRWILLAMTCAAVCPGFVQAETLRVGPEGEFALPSKAIAAAKDGDVIEIASGTYEDDWATIRASDLTLRAAAPGVVLSSSGMIPNGKAIWVVAGDRVVIEGIEFRGARAEHRNGAGLRLERRDVTLRGCRFFDNENGILGGRGDSVVTIHHCEFGHNSLVAQPGTHNLYIGPCARLDFRFNYSHHAKTCHLLKSRARENLIMYNRLADEADGTSSYVANFPNAGRVFLVGNVLHQGPACQNRVLVAYGEEGPKGDDHALVMLNNTLVNENTEGSPVFVQVRRLDDDFTVNLVNNIFAGKGEVTNWDRSRLASNFVAALDRVGFVDLAGRDFHLTADSPCVDGGTVPRVPGMDLRMSVNYQYVHPAKKEPRPDEGPLDIGAFERRR